MDSKKKVLVIGNGFDLAHGLLSSYNDFFVVISEWIDFEKAFYETLKNKDKDSKYKKYFNEIESIDIGEIKKLGQIIRKNSWISYYVQCGAELKGWIDFEKEMIPVITLFGKVLSLDMLTVGHGGDTAECRIPKEVMSPSLKRIARLWRNYFSISNDQFSVVSKYGSHRHGLLKENLIEDLRKEFAEFIVALEIYIQEFVEKNFLDIKLKQIEEINADLVISFNYTETELRYTTIRPEAVYHIHGKVSEIPNSMVVGVNELVNDFDNTFIYFVKYFQRIQKHSSIAYKKEIGEEIELYVYGHSLDVTDKDILEYLFDKSQKITIFFYNQVDYEKKILNLISNFGREKLEENMENGRLLFVITDNTPV